MSENLNRSSQDFSKYDSMSIEELEEILRADAMGPERDDSDVDEILYVMEVLAKKRRQNGIARKTALEAHQEFQQYYHPLVEEKSAPKRKSNIIPFRRIAAMAACFVLVFSLATSAYAFSFSDIWDAVVTWAQETFSISTSCVDERTPYEGSNLEYVSLQDALSRNNRNSDFLPTWIPPEYKLDDITIEDTPMQEMYIALYSNGSHSLKISIKSFLNSESEHIEKSDDFTEIYHCNGIDYYIFTNHNQIRVVWITDIYECYLSGKLSIDEIKLMIDSIGKG